ncbi:hypothetical protein BDQ17DRAFT_1461401 [Cyathus striatus]|nr:hypothetical protein BDQ17DRAFT_1461401 [Cyathus striatus]
MPRSLSDVPEEDPSTTPTAPSPISALSASFTPASGSASTFGGGGHTSNPSVSSTGAASVISVPSLPRTSSSISSITAGRKSSSRTLSRDPASSIGPSGSSVKRSTSMSSTHHSGQPRSSSSSAATRQAHAVPRKQSTPRLPHDKEAGLAPSTVMYWSRAPAHSATLVDSTIWIVGGNEDKEKEKDVYCFDTVFLFSNQTMQWTRPEITGDQPPPSRAHSATLIDRKILVIGGGVAGSYFDTVYVLDTSLRRWSRPVLTPGPKPASRRSHSAVYYQGKVWVFGGGCGMRALNDLWTLDVTGLGSGKPLRWEEVKTTGSVPKNRGYHTSTLVGNIMDISYLNLDTLAWSTIELEARYRRLAHSATQVGSYLFIVGGHDGSNGAECTLMHARTTVSLSYESRSLLGTPPTKRGNHSAIVADSRLFVIGGFNGRDGFDDVYILDLAASAYLPQVRSFTFGDGFWRGD